MWDYVLSILHDPGNPRWQFDLPSSPEVQVTLEFTERVFEQYYTVQRHEALPELFVKVHAFLALPMSMRQRIHLNRNLAIVLMFQDKYIDALRYIDEALRVARMYSATKEPIYDVLAELHQVRSRFNRGLLRIGDTLHDLRESLRFQREHKHHGGTFQASAYLLALTDEATWEYYTGDLKSLQGTIAEANHMYLPIQGNEMSRANLLWMEARLDQITGNLRRATESMRVAQALYEERANLTSQDRILYDVAEIHLDYATKLPEGTMRDNTLTYAENCVMRSLELAREVKDDNGRMLASLAYAHFARLTGANVDRMHLITYAQAFGENENDQALQAQALIALGDEYLARGSYDAARNCWGQAISLLDGSELAIFQLIAWRRIIAAESRYDRY